MIDPLYPESLLPGIVEGVKAHLFRFFCVRWLLRYIAANDFTPFAWYRSVFGLVVPWTSRSGLVARG